VEVDVEEATLRAFIRRTRVERYVALLRTRTRRKKLIREIHDLDLDSRFVFTVAPNDQTPERVYELLRRCGAPEDCYVMSESDLDGGWMDLQDALDETVATGTATLISCIPGELAYYEGEDMHLRYILQRLERSDAKQSRQAGAGGELK
jgi:hypothetical protein